MKKTVGLIIVLILTLIALTGCANVNYELQVNKDGSGEISYIYGISKGQFGIDLIEELVSSVKENAEEKGYSVEVYEDNEITGLKAGKHLNNVTTEFSIQEFFEVFGEEYIENTENNGIKINKNFFNTSYSQKTELDLSKIKAEVNLMYTIKLPTKANENNANQVSEDGKTLTWNIETGKINNIEFVAEQINVWIFVIFGAVVIAIVAIIVFIFLKKKTVTKKEN